MTDTYGWGYSKRYFDRLMWLSYPGWAWEFKRRDPSLLGACRTAQSQPIYLRRRDGSQLIRLTRPSRYAESLGLHFLPDPRLSAFDTPVFWLPEVMTNLNALAETRSNSPEHHQLTWRDIPGKKAFLIAVGHHQLLTINAKGFAAQLAIEPSSPPLPVAIYLTLQLRSGVHMLDYVRCLDQFARHCSGLQISMAHRRGLSPQKLRQSLIALDGWLDGASHREIATRIFGEERVKDDWDNGVLSLKSRTRRLIKKGRSLMETEYLSLL